MVRAGEVGWFWEALSQLLFLRRGGPEAKKKVNERGERQAVYIRGWNLNRGGLGVVAVWELGVLPAPVVSGLFYVDARRCYRYKVQRLEA